MNDCGIAQYALTTWGDACNRLLSHNQCMYLYLKTLQPWIWKKGLKF